MKYFVYSFVTILLVGALVIDYLDDVGRHAIARASAQEPLRRQSSDTLLGGRDSMLGGLSLDGVDSLPRVWHIPMHHAVTLNNEPVWKDSTFHFEPFYFHLPYWNVYRRSFTVWGITFSTGQPNPYNPYPQSNALDASVDSHPLNRPK